MAKKTVLAIDLGAESGRVMAVHFDGRTLTYEPLYRFSNTAVSVRETLHWDVLRLWCDIQDGIEKGKVHHPAAIGLDTWGVDFALLDKDGRLIANPVHYRDGRTAGMMERVFATVPKAEVFAQTGIQFMSINTLYQLFSLVENRSPQLEIAATFLTIPDLFNYWLTGVKACEFSNATTTQMFNPHSGTWATEMLGRLHIPSHILPDIILPGTRLGAYQSIPVIAPACHDTGSAVAAIPAAVPAADPSSKDYAYISSGTWSLVGLEVEQAIINEAALAANLTNEGGVNGTFRLLKNVVGLWILQQCRAVWEREGTAVSYDELIQLAREARPHQSLIIPDHPDFLPPGNHPQLIHQHCMRSEQPTPDSIGAVARCVLESLALAYREVLEQLAAVSGQPIRTIHIVGGGSQNELLNQMTADATGLPVIAGPVEATVIGNALVQLIALGELRDLAEARQLVANMGGLRRYEPQDTAAWDEAYGRFLQISGKQ